MFFSPLFDGPGKTNPGKSTFKAKGISKPETKNSKHKNQKTYLTLLFEFWLTSHLFVVPECLGISRDSEGDLFGVSYGFSNVFQGSWENALGKSRESNNSKHPNQKLKPRCIELLFRGVIFEY